MNLQNVKYFISVAQHGNFKNAAEKEFCSPQCLYQAVAKLEQELGQQLFDRTSTSFQLTEYGYWLLQNYAKPLLEISSRMETSYDEFVNRHRKPITVDIVGRPVDYINVIHQAADLYSQRHAGQKILCRNAAPRQAVDNIRSGCTDLAFLWKTPHSAGTKRCLSVPIEMAVYASKKHPLTKEATVTIQDLTNEPIWFFNASVYKGMSIWQKTGLSERNAFISSPQNAASVFMYENGHMVRIMPVMDYSSMHTGIFSESICIPFEPRIMEEYIFVTADCFKPPESILNFLRCFCECCEEQLGIAPEWI